MADPVVSITAGVPTSGTGTITTLGQTLLDGAQVTQGAIADAAVTAGATGTMSAKLRALSRDIGSLVTAIGSTAWDLGTGTGGSRTQRVMLDSTQLDPVVAHDAVDSGAPYKQGFKATTALSGLTLVASADRTDGFAGIDGVQIVRPHCNLEDIVTGNVTCTAGASTTAVAAQGAGLKFYMTDALISNDGSTGGRCAISDGSRTITVPFSADGAVKGFNNPVPFAANTAVTADPTGSDDILVTLIGFKSKV